MRHLGHVGKKVLLLLQAGLVLSLTGRPDAYFKILKDVAKEWRKVNERSLRESIKKLYKAKIIDYKENKDGTVRLVLTEVGQKKVLVYNLDKIEIKKPLKWDRLWRVVTFDIPEDKKKGRTALAVKLKEIGFYPMQKSVFIHPHECKNEIDFIAEIFELVPYIRYLRVRDVDIELDLRNRFGLL